MESFEKAKLALRQFLLNNKERVASDLNAMREKSEGIDVFRYIDHISSELSFGNIAVTNNIIFGSLALENNGIESYFLCPEPFELMFYPPPNNSLSKSKRKDPEIPSGSFFFLILQHERSKKSSLFL